MHETRDRLLLCVRRFGPTAPMHVFLGQTHHPPDHVEAEAALEILLVVDHVNEAPVQAELHVEVREVLWDGSPQPLHASVDEFLGVVLAPLIFSFVDCLKQSRG